MGFPTLIFSVPMFNPVLFSLLGRYTRKTFLSDLVSGAIVGIVALPLAIAFAIASGVPPEVGLITAVVAGFLISFFGGSRVQIGGPSGAFIIVIAGVSAQFGMEGVVVVSVMAGIMLVAMGLLKAGSIIQFTPYPIVVGFTSGMALIIFSTQMKEFFGLPEGDIPADLLPKWIYYFRNIHLANWNAVGIGLITVLITVYWARVTRRIPGSLVALLLTTLAVQAFQLPVATIGSTFGEFGASLRVPDLPGLNFELVKQLLVPAFTIAMLGSLESLLSAIVADGATGYRHRPNTELVSQGIANIISPLTGGMAASGALAKTMTNVRNGGKTPVAGLIHALVLMCFLVFMGRLAMMIPLASLAGILVIVSYNMSEWRSFKSILKSSKSEISVLLTTFLLTVFVGLDIAIPFGIILALVLFVRRVMETTDIEVLKHEVENERSYLSEDTETLDIPKGVEVFQIKGPFFFGIANKFEEAEKEIHEIPKVRIIRMRRVPFIDSTGIRNLRSFVNRSKKHRTHTVLSGVTDKTLEALKKDGFYEELGPENFCSTIECALIRARKILGNS